MMKKSIGIFSALASISIASPALADDAMDVESMVEQSQVTSYQAITPRADAFDIARLATHRNADFMATMSSQFNHGYRFNQPAANFERDSNAGLAALFVPEQFAFRSNAQDSGVDAVTPGRFLSSSVRSDYLSDAGPAARDKSSVGIKFGF